MHLDAECNVFGDFGDVALKGWGCEVASVVLLLLLLMMMMMMIIIIIIIIIIIKIIMMSNNNNDIPTAQRAPVLRRTSLHVRGPQDRCTAARCMQAPAIQQGLVFGIEGWCLE